MVKYLRLCQTDSSLSAELKGIQSTQRNLDLLRMWKWQTSGASTQLWSGTPQKMMATVRSLDTPSRKQTWRPRWRKGEKLKCFEMWFRLLNLWPLFFWRALKRSRNGSPFTSTTDGQTARFQIWSWVMSICSESTVRTSADWARSRATARTQLPLLRQVCLCVCVTAQITASVRT